jgi:uncharacterized protein
MNSPEPSTPSRLADELVRFRFVLLPVALVLLAAGWPIARELKFDQSIESLYTQDDPHLADYRASKRLFGGDEFAVVAYADPELLDGGVVSKPARNRLHELAKRLNEVPGISPRSTQDLDDLTERIDKLVKERALAVTVRVLRQHGLSGFRKLKSAREDAITGVYHEIDGILLGKDNTTAVVLRLTPENQLPKGRTRGETIADIRRVAAEFGEEHNVTVAVVGEPVQVHDMFRYVEEDGQTLFLWSLVLLGGVILALFRSLRWMLLPLLVVVAALVWTDALLVLSGMQLSMVSSMMNSLVTIIAVATVTHVTVQFREQRREHEPVEAARRTFAVLLPPIFWTIATTAAGFGALVSSSITPVRSFGLMLASATLMVLIAVCMVLPGGILFGRIDRDPRYAPAEDRLAKFLSHSADVVQRRPLTVSLVTFAIFAFAAAGLLRTTVETDFSKNFRKSSPIVQSLEFVETKLGGAGTWEINFPAPEKLDKEYLDKVRELARRLREEFILPDNAVGRVSNPSVNPAQTDRRVENPSYDEPPISDASGLRGEVTKVVALTDGLDAIPAILADSIDERLQLVRQLLPEFADGLYAPEARRMRIVLRSREREQSRKKLQLIARVKEIADDWAATELGGEFTAEERQTRATGLYVLLAFLIDNLLKDQWLSFGLAATAIVLMMTVAYRSLLIGLLSLLPNTFPIVLVIGGIGWLGIPINIATAMIASVSMGLTVDSSIHYISGYRRSRSRGLSVAAALDETQQNVGRALVFANFALIVGFSVLTLSHFIPLVYFGILVSVAMFGGLIGNLVLLPLMLRWIDRQQVNQHEATEDTAKEGRNGNGNPRQA